MKINRRPSGHRYFLVKVLSEELMNCYKGKVMKKLFVFSLLTALFSAQAVLATQEEDLKKYLKSKKGQPPQQSYKTPDIYNKVPPKNALTEEDASTTPAPAGIRPFGYDLFDAPLQEFLLPSEAPVPENYVLGPGDNIILNLWGRVEKTYNLIIDREGKVFIPKAGEITIWGLTLEQAENKVEQLLSTIYSDFSLSAVLGKIKSIKVFVYGEVKRPGAYTVSSLSTLFNVLYMSGGPNARGSLRNIQVFRNSNKLKTIDLYGLLLHGRNQDVRLANNDVIFIPVVSITATISGCIKRSAVYELLGGERVKDLIDLAGGLKPDAFLDRISLERIEQNSKRIVLDLNMDGSTDNKDNLLLKDGDIVRIYSVYNYQENTVVLEGSVKYPGVFEYKTNMRVKDLIDNGGQLTVASYLNRANLVRTYDDLSKEVFAVDLNAVISGDSTADIWLKERDKLIVFDKDEVRHVPYVSIEGKIKKKGSYELTKNMRLSDLIFLAGGLDKSAYLLYAEIARMSSGKPSKILHVNLDNCLKTPYGSDDNFLKEDDKIFIREIPEWKLHALVQLGGEVRFPGRYALMKKHEMLSELIERAGGFTENAFLRGAIFERISIANDLKRQRLNDIMINLQEVTADTVVQKIQEKQLNAIRSNEVNRIILDLEDLFLRNDISQDIELREDDRIFIPEMPSGVHVLGAVASSGTIKFLESRNYKYYLKQAGGIVKSADKNEIRIVKPDGKVFKKKLTKVKIEIGDSIVIPKRVLKDREWLKIFTSSFTILSGALTTVYVLSRL